jgi:hypothetical protein
MTKARIRNRLRVVAALVVTLVSVTGVPAAHAGQNAGSMAGTGTINPGLPCPASGCSIHADFTLVLGGQDAAGTASCTFDGTDTFPGGATVVSGSGSGTVSCSGGFSAQGTVSYTRTGNVTTFTGNLTVNGIVCVIVVWSGLWIWASVGPVAAFVWIAPFVVIVCV